MLQERRWAEAADAYRELEVAFPNSSEAKVILVSLGQLELNHLGRADLALQRFDTYLKAGDQGVLTQEARFARIKALRALGRTAAEVDAIEEFLNLYPDSFEVKVLRERLRALNQ
jgi:outer membrane protein assembly factor BamD (BamD/ComL family)